MLLPQDPAENWSKVHLLIFRFLSTYFVLYLALKLTGFSLEASLRWFAENILHWGSDFEAKSTGSGDRTFDFVLLAFNALLTAAIVPIWSVVDRHRQSYQKLFYWFQILLRTALFFLMLLYGLGQSIQGPISWS